MAVTATRSTPVLTIVNRSGNLPNVRFSVVQYLDSVRFEVPLDRMVQQVENTGPFLIKHSICHQCDSSVLSALSVVEMRSCFWPQITQITRITGIKSHPQRRSKPEQLTQPGAVQLKIPQQDLPVAPLNDTIKGTFQSSCQRSGPCDVTDCGPALCFSGPSADGHSCRERRSRLGRGG